MDEEQYLRAYEKLNNKQREAVDTIDGPLLVVAGPGTGKTELLALRVANIIRSTEVTAHNILCLTFTENGAINMRERLARYIGNDAYRVGIFTFHGFCNNIISRFPEYFYHAANYSQATDIERAEIVDEIFRTLPHGHPLASFHPEEGYVYKRDVIDRIKHIKSGGYTPLEYQKIVEVLLSEYDAIEKILADWPKGRASIKRIAEYRVIEERIRSLNTTTSMRLAHTLGGAINDAEAEGKMEPISSWKRKFLAETEQEGELTLKDIAQKDKIRAVAEFYRLYQEKLTALARYDFDDTIIEVLHALASNHMLKSEVEEQYQYILVDEFQDTNEAQMRLIHAITDSYIYEGKPNVMVVGDDDQAIYKFQGAEISNIIEFRTKTYVEVRTIVLDTNYRSHRDILALARSVVTQGADRLEHLYDDVKKVLTQGNKSLLKGEIVLRTFETDIEEYRFVSDEIKNLLDQQVSPKEIAIIGRNHKELRALLPYLDRAHIPYHYLKRSNVFDQPHIKELITVCRYLTSVHGETKREDDLLPEILSYPYWDIPRQTLFAVALHAHDAHKSWAQAVTDMHDEKLNEATRLLGELAVDALAQPLEHIIEQYIERSGFKTHYFHSDSLKTQSSQYIEFLAALRTFIEALREWRSGEPIFVHDVWNFVSIHRSNDIPLVAESPFSRSMNAVEVLTAHAAKGLEFQNVFIISAHDRSWTRLGRANKATLPLALMPILNPAGDDEDDFIRLLYVAITRAKEHLVITGHETLVRYLGEHNVTSTEREVPQAEIIDHERAYAITAPPYNTDETSILHRFVEHYQMSVTHLNNFLDVTKGGPQYFIEQNLLRFPQPMSVASVYGSAIHTALEEIVMFPKFHGGDKAPEERVIAIFERELRKGRLPKHEEEKQRTRGLNVLSAYYHDQSKLFSSNDEIEVDMKHEGIYINEAHLTGKIDLLRISGDSQSVIDFKTGRAYRAWDEAKLADHDKIKLYRNRQQLIFYKLLLDHSIHHHRKITDLAVQFVEGVLDGGEPITLSYLPSDDDIERLKLLVGAVYKKIKTLDIPDVTHYKQDLSGIIAFEEDLIQGVI